ncbi:MAG: hypothetical protein K8F91_00945 [Candidatus Obscuribacterales bacterium]|nr:hypothetical protein [Candidatus Obscuribacterales bacterium]
MKRAISMLGALALAAGFFTLAAPAAHAETHNNVTCTDYTSASGTYPADGSHFKICFSPVDNDRLDDVVGAVTTLPTNNGSGAQKVRDLIESKGSTFYYFKNRADHNAFMSGKYSGQVQFQNQTAICGHTGYQAVPFGQNIAASIFDKCIMQGSTVDNPDLYKVTKHEAGHAFDFALAANKNPFTEDRTKGPSLSVGYRNFRDHDLTVNLPTIPMCTLFQGTPSAYEIALTATPGTVCNGSTLNSGYGPNDQVSTALAKAPYFVKQTGNSRYGELFAEQITIVGGTVGGITNPKQFVLTDNIIKDNRMKCTFFVARAYWHTLNPPGPNNPNNGYKNLPSGCPATSESNLK